MFSEWTPQSSSPLGTCMCRKHTQERHLNWKGLIIELRKTQNIPLGSDIELKSSVHANRLKLYKYLRDFRPSHVNNNNGYVQMMKIEIMIISKMVRIMKLIE